MNEIDRFNQAKNENIEKLGENERAKKLGLDFVEESSRNNYSYNFTWMGRPIIQYPQDIVAMQELIWNVKPDLIIETGIAHGGSLILYASILELVGSGEILGIDIDIRDHNKHEIEKHPMSKRIKMIQGSSIDPSVLDQVAKYAEGKKNIMVVLDSNHTHDHVQKELAAYSKYVSKDNYLIVFDSIIEDLPEDYFPDRPWGKGDNPKTAVWEFVEENPNFIIDESIHNKLLITVAPDGYLKRIG